MTHLPQNQSRRGLVWMCGWVRVYHLFLDGNRSNATHKLGKHANDV